MQPLVSWWKRDNSEQFQKWDIGVVDAGTPSPLTGFLIWNNKGGADDVANMEDCIITTKGPGGINTGSLVEGQWIKVKLDAVDENFFSIGFDTAANETVSRPIKALGSTVYNAVTSKPDVHPHVSDNGVVNILGVANRGNKVDSAGNFAEITAFADVPGNASAGLVKFLLRTTFQYQ